MILHRWTFAAALVLILLLTAPAATVAQTFELQIEHTIDPETIFTKSSGQSPDSAAVKILLRGLPAPEKPLDLVFVLDRSASVTLSTIQKIGKEFLHHLAENDRIAMVSFAETAEVRLSLSPDRAQAYQIIDAAQPGKQTALGEALALAIDELLTNGRPEAFRAILLPSDGNSLTGRLPLPEAERAGQNNIPIYALGVSGAANRTALSQIALKSGGAFFGAYNARVYESILKKLGRQAVARFLRMTVTLPPQIIFESAFEPVQVRRGARGATVLEWTLPVVVTGETRTVTFQIGARQGGAIELGQAPSVVVYRDAKDKPQKQNIPTIRLTANKINKPPYAAFRFTPETPRPNDQVCFHAAESRDPDGTIVQYEWDWDGDGIFDETATETRVCHIFPSGGNFNVTLRVTDEDGATAQLSKTVTVNSAPGAPSAIPRAQFVFAPAVPNAGDTVEFDASASQSGNGEITQYEWDWNGDGVFDETATVPTAQHVFSDSGERKVSLRVTNSQGRSAVFTAIVTVIGRVPLGFDINSLATASGELSVQPWLPYYTRDGRVTDEELKDAATRFGIGVYVPGTRYLLTQQDLETLNHLNYSYKAFSRYREVSVAHAEGYRPLGAFVAGLGQVYLSERILNAPLALATPPMLFYDSSQRLVGVRYVAFKRDEGRLFGFSVESWPKAGEAFVLTIWLVPNPNGPFAASNPNVK